MPSRKPTDDLTPAQLEQLRLGQALSAVRRKAGLVQEQVAACFGVSTQAYQRYEAGARRLPEFKLTQLAGAIGATLDDVMRERAALDEPPAGMVVHLPLRPGTASQEPTLQLGPQTDQLRLTTAALSPWADIGELIVFDRARPPRRDQGCVIEAQDGTLSVFIFADRDDDTVRLYTLAPERRTVTRAAADLRGIYAVRLRGD